jgi:hypothetical protein
MHPSLATVRKPILVAAALGVIALALLLILMRLNGPSSAFASSHAEAPLISQDPRADNTDLYAFVSPDNTNTVTMIANYIPLGAPASRTSTASTTPFSTRSRSTIWDGRLDLAYSSASTRDAEPEHVPLQHQPDHLAYDSAATGRRPTASRSSTSKRTA